MAYTMYNSLNYYKIVIFAVFLYGIICTQQFVTTAEPCSVCGVLSPCGFFGDHIYSNVSYQSIPYQFMFIVMLWFLPSILYSVYGSLDYIKT